MRNTLIALAVGLVTLCWISSIAAAQTGPSFTCPSPRDPLAQLICSHPDLAQADLWYVQAYQALRAQLDPGGQSKLRQEAVAFNQTVRSQCNIGAPDSGKTASSTAIPCVQRHYMAQRDLLAGRLTGAAAEEASRPLQAHVALQGDLKSLGFLPPDADVDGVFGPVTRTAIQKWQQSRGRRLTGFLDNSDGALLEQQAASLQAQATGTPTALFPATSAKQPRPTPPATEATKEAAPAPLQQPQITTDPRTGNATVTVTGFGATVDEARTSAIRQALQQTITQLVVVERAIKNDQLLRDNVFSTMNGYVERFTQRSLDKTANGVEITADIVVSASRIENFIGIPQGSSASVEGLSLLAESNRELAQRKARGEIFDRVLRGFPTTVSEVRITDINHSESDPGTLSVGFELTFKPVFIRSLTETMRALSISSCEVFPSSAWHPHSPGRRLDTIRTTSDLQFMKSTCSSQQLELARSRPVVCVYHTNRTECFILELGDYCAECRRTLRLPWGYRPKLVVVYTFLDNERNSALSEGAKCKQAQVAASTRTFVSGHPQVAGLDVHGSKQIFIGLDVSAVKGRFLVPQSAVELGRAVNLVAVMGLGFDFGGRMTSVFFDFLNEAGKSDQCTLLDALTAQMVPGNINGR